MRLFLWSCLVPGVLALPLAARADDLDLGPVAASLAAVRAVPPSARGERGASEFLTKAKHRLREWIEAQLPSLPQDGDERELERRLNAAVATEFLCQADAVDRCTRDPTGPGEPFDALGYLGRISVGRSDRHAGAASRPTYGRLAWCWARSTIAGRLCTS